MLAERTNSRVCEFCLLFAVTLEFVVLQIQLRLFSPPEFASFTFMPLHLSSDAEFQAVLRKPSTASPSSKICRIVLLSASSRFILYALNLSVVRSSWTQTMHHRTCSYVPLFPHIFAHISKKERPVFVAQWWVDNTSGNMAHTFKAAGTNKAVGTNQIILTWNY